MDTINTDSNGYSSKMINKLSIIEALKILLTIFSYSYILFNAQTGNANKAMFRNTTY